MMEDVHLGGCPHQSNPGIERLKQVADTAEFKGRQPAMLIEFEIIVDDHRKTDKEVGGSDASESDQSVLTDGDPWRVADTQKDGLVTVSGGAINDGMQRLT